MELQQGADDRLLLQHNLRNLPDPHSQFPTWNKLVLVFYSEVQESEDVLPNYREKEQKNAYMDQANYV